MGRYHGDTVVGEDCGVDLIDSPQKILIDDFGGLAGSNDLPARHHYELIAVARGEVEIVNGHDGQAVALGNHRTDLREQADLVALDLSALEIQPLYDPISQLVYAGARQQVHWVWIAGHARLRERELTNIDVPALTARVRAWGERIAALPRATA